MGVNTRQIAKNTILLYIRMLLLLAVSLYTSRVVLDVLGVEDYGIYNLIAGFVTFLAFISNALVSAMQRYFNVALGRKDLKYYSEIFSMSINILCGFSLVIIIVGESLGVWFVTNYLNIPSDRTEATMWVYHISLLTFIANTLRTPFHASIIAHEKMSFYAYVSLVEVFVRLGMVFILLIIPTDHLITYAILYFVVILMIDIIYVQYCHIKFRECHYKIIRNKELFKELISFSGWTIFGQASVMIKNQGEAFFINRFFSVVANAAMGVAVQVANALELFVSNFQTAFNPQLIQTYASNELIEHKKLLFRASKFSYFLLLIMVIPLIANVDFLLNTWLVEVPEYTNYFIVFILISYLFSALSTPFVTSIFATGKIKSYQSLLSVTFLCGLVLVFIFLYNGAAPYSVSIVAVIIHIFLLLIRLLLARKYIGISIRQYFVDVIIPITIVTLLSLTVPYVCFLFCNSMFLRILSIIIDVLFVGVLIILLGLNKTERNYIIYLKNKIL